MSEGLNGSFALVGRDFLVQWSRVRRVEVRIWTKEQVMIFLYWSFSKGMSEYDLLPCLMFLFLLLRSGSGQRDTIVSTINWSSRPVATHAWCSSISLVSPRNPTEVWMSPMKQSNEQRRENPKDSISLFVVQGRNGRGFEWRSTAVRVRRTRRIGLRRSMVLEWSLAVGFSQLRWTSHS